MSTIKFDTWQDSAGSRELAPCTAWVNFNGAGTVAIRDSLNVSSITDNGTGNYTVNFETAMDNANYAPIITVGRGATGVQLTARFAGINSADPSVSGCRFNVNTDSPSASDVEYSCVAIFGGIS